MYRGRLFDCAIFYTPVTSPHTCIFNVITCLGDVIIKLSLHLTRSEWIVLSHSSHHNQRSSQQRRVVLVWGYPHCYKLGSTMTSLSTIKHSRSWQPSREIITCIISVILCEIVEVSFWNVANSNLWPSKKRSKQWGSTSSMTRWDSKLNALQLDKQMADLSRPVFGGPSVTGILIHLICDPC